MHPNVVATNDNTKANLMYNTRDGLISRISYMGQSVLRDSETVDVRPRNFDVVF